MASLELIVSFSAAARHASFASAARELGLTPSAVAKNVARLEAQLGVRLFQRTTRQVTLSPDGEALHARCQRILEELESLDAAAADARTGPRGTLRIDMPLVYGRLVVLPVLARLRTSHPELKIDARFSDGVVDIIRDGLDAAVRIGPLADSRLVGRQFDKQQIWTCASPAYLARHGAPQTPADVLRHTCLLFRLPSSGRDRPWQFRSGRRDLSLMPDGEVRLGDGEALVQAAVAGLGLVQVPSYMAGQEVARGGLVEVLQKYRPAALPVSLVYPSHRHIPLRVRALADALSVQRYN
ncbi:LysR family transcriptional regulator [Cupriavidus sp. NPDC089707]|uniref:LysR family transcriptional regulator n=1 Tax=Cupriavidus sp. NPDC089707 TaxID=3363963 RepID=UPI0037F604EF